MNNFFFNVNGSGDENLHKTINLLYSLKNNINVLQFEPKFEGYVIDENSGFILFMKINSKLKRDYDNINVFNVPKTTCKVIPIILSYLYSDEAEYIRASQYGSNIFSSDKYFTGWRVHTDDYSTFSSNPTLDRFGILCAIEKVQLEICTN